MLNSELIRCKALPVEQFAEVINVAQAGVAKMAEASEDSSVVVLTADDAAFLVNLLKIAQKYEAVDIDKFFELFSTLTGVPTGNG